ncbi:enoyl-CoA hydratase/isomerase family protein [Haloechinothrix sp. YIM 98757]|uniref:Enoyl-CoA hydratase/isomerase family protein n=1 Tax=Haloechinothrix aidingensis TaxID=2752311 RepID=A0A838AAJ1_9PSEU|nr:enoyl-CoA hydratase-related protein [Haloechinothrix aidingensis]MBA0126253.1 enoyl-CoA hydratase/isomerase family protein [Haloechinothrix aidingensis]
MADELVHYAVSGGIATITLDSPHNRNALSAQLRRELGAGLTAASEDPDVRVIVLDHTSEVFCAGMDLKEARDTDASEQGVNEFPNILTQILTSAKPVVAKLAGPARAGGVGIVAAADISVASRAATFAFTEVRLGLVPAVISVPILPRLLPRQARELFLTGERFDADRAAQVGLVNSAVDPESLDDEVDRYVTALARGGPNALAATKRLLDSHDELPQRFDEMLSLSAEFFAGSEAQEGIAAFAQKRAPGWVPE